MTLVAIVCPSCNGKVDDFDIQSNSGVCPYCGAVITAALPQNGGAVDGNFYNRAVSMRKLGKLDEALGFISEYTQLYPDDFRGWVLYSEIALEKFEAEFNDYGKNGSEDHPAVQSLRRIEEGVSCMQKTAHDALEVAQMQSFSTELTKCGDMVASVIGNRQSSVERTQAKIDEAYENAPVGDDRTDNERLEEVKKAVTAKRNKRENIIGFSLSGIILVMSIIYFGVMPGIIVGIVGFVIISSVVPYFTGQSAQSKIEAAEAAVRHNHHERREAEAKAMPHTYEMQNLRKQLDRLEEMEKRINSMAISCGKSS